MRPKRMLVVATTVAVLLGCSSGHDVIAEFDGLVALDVLVTDTTGARLAATDLAVSLSSVAFPSVIGESFSASTDTLGQFQYLIRTRLLDTLVVLRVTVQPPSGSGLGSQRDSVITRMWVQEPPLDTARFRFRLY